MYIQNQETRRVCVQINVNEILVMVKKNTIMHFIIASCSSKIACIHQTSAISLLDSLLISI